MKQFKWTAVTLLVLNLMAVVGIFVATTVLSGAPDWGLIGLTLYVMAGWPIALGVGIMFMAHVAWPLFLWLLWTYFSMIEVLLGIPFGTWLGRQIIMTPTPTLHKGLNAWLYRQVCAAGSIQKAAGRDD